MGSQSGMSDNDEVLFGRHLWAPLMPRDSWPPPWVPLYVTLPAWTLRESARGVWTLHANPHGWPATPECYIAPVGDVEIELVILFWGSSDPACPATPRLSVSNTLPVHPPRPHHPHHLHHHHTTACDTPVMQMSDRAAHADRYVVFTRVGRTRVYVRAPNCIVVM